MKTVKFKELPEKVREFLQREYAFAFILSDSVELDWLHKINEWSKATDEERLAYAEWRFPKGKKFKKLNLFRDGGKEIVSSGEIEISSAGIDVDGNFLYYVDVNSSDPTQVNKWAEIIEEAKPEKEEQPEFKAGDEATLDGSDANTVFKIVHIQDGRAWIKTEGMMFGRLVMLYRLRKPDPDKVYRDTAKLMIERYVKGVACSGEGGTLKPYKTCEYMFEDNGLEEMLIEAIKKGKEL